MNCIVILAATVDPANSDRASAAIFTDTSSTTTATSNTVAAATATITTTVQSRTFCAGKKTGYYLGTILSIASKSI